MEARKYRNGYIRCKAECIYNESSCFNLVGNTENLEQLAEILEIMKSKGLANEKTTLKRLFEYMKQIKIFNYDAIRVDGVKSNNFKSQFNQTLTFEIGIPAFFDLKPAIQICFLAKNSLGLRNYEIDFPENYR